MTPADHRAYFFKIDTTIKKIRQALQKKLDAAGLDLTVDQWVILDHVFRNEGISQNTLAELTTKDAPTVTRILDLLIKKKLAERRPDGGDRRKFSIVLTDAGREKFHAALPVVIEVRRKGWGTLGDEEYHTFTRILDEIYRNISA